MLAVFLYLGLAMCSPANWNYNPILKINSRTQDRTVVLGHIYEAYDSLGTKNTFKPKNEKECVEFTTVKYFLTSVDLKQREFVASECRTNLNSKFHSILEPIPEVFDSIHGPRNKTAGELEALLIEQFQKHPVLSTYLFYEFDDLDYSLECLVGYQELMQVKLKETAMEVTLQKTVSIPDACGFQRTSPEFDGTTTSTVYLDIPLHGNFFCKKGRSFTCRRQQAETKNSRYKLIE